VLATKVGRYGDHAFDFTAGRMARSVHESLARLGVNHIDLIQCHDIEFGSLDQIAHETMPALRALQDMGLVRGVGITGYPLVLACRLRSLRLGGPTACVRRRARARVSMAAGIRAAGAGRARTGRCPAAQAAWRRAR
jgi:hypothetical protein